MPPASTTGPATAQPQTIEDDIREDRALIDRILLLRSLASDQVTAEKMMEPLIVVTGHWQSNAPLSIRDRAALDELESKLKEYLVVGDPAHAFTVQSLERRLQQPPTDRKPKNWRVLLYVLAIATLAVGVYFVASII